MQIKFTTPPEWDLIKEKFNLTENQHILYTHGNCMYSPSKISPTDDLIRHEEVHAEQQGYSDDVAKLWWQRYIHDPVWRIEQEAEAYGAQYYFLCQKYKDRNTRARYLAQMAYAISGPVYGNATTYAEASKMIRQFARMGRPPLKKFA